jgi:hypothetical protein
VRRNSPSVIALQAPVLLPLHDLADGLVLHFAQLRARDLVALEVTIARREELPRAQEAADVVGAERGRGPFGHGAASIAQINCG